MADNNASGSKDFMFPDVGEGIHEGKLIAWKVKEGDSVKQDQVLCEVETDKAVVEIPSPQAGVITKLHHAAGTVMKVGAPLVTFNGTMGATPATPAPPPVQAPPQTAPATPPPLPPSQPVPVANEFNRPIESGTRKIESTLVPPLPNTISHAAIDTVNAPTSSSADSHRALAAPSTRKLAREKGVDLERVRGSGPGGRVLDSDVIAASGGAAPSAPAAMNAQRPAVPAPAPQYAPAAPAYAPAPANGNSISYSGRRKVIGDHMMAGHAVPTVTLFAEADVTALMEVRERLKPKSEAAGVKLTPLAFITKAVCSVLKTYPVFNSTLSADTINLIPNENIGIAVDTPKGLVVPVVKNAESLSILDIARQIQLLADAARKDSLTLDQMRGSTFTISSIGAGRVEGFTQILNTPEEGILGVGGIIEKPRVYKGAIAIRKAVTLALTFDHRVADGAAGAKFLTTLVEMLEDPELMLLEGV